jgi:hypothetical protein
MFLFPILCFKSFVILCCQLPKICNNFYQSKWHNIPEDLNLQREPEILHILFSVSNCELNKVTPKCITKFALYSCQYVL